MATRRANVLLALFAWAAVSAPGDEPAPATAPDPRITAKVDARVELLSIVFRLAGNPEYNDKAAHSPYAERVERRFAPQREHPVVHLARKLRNQNGVSYDAVMSMAVHLTDTLELDERIPFDSPPDRLDQRWSTADARKFLVAARDFVQVTGFTDFLEEERNFYAQASARMNTRLAEFSLLPWFENYFGARPKAEFHLYLGLLNGGSCYGVGVRFPDGREEILPVIGVWQWDAEGLPRFPAQIENTIAHELCHSYTNPLVDRFEAQLLPAGTRMFAARAEQMRAQAYGNAKTVLYETLVRACCVRYAHARGGPSRALQSIAYEHSRGFTWTGALARLLGEYERDRQTYPDLAAFMPRIIALLEQETQNLNTLAVAAPRMVQILPANGATDVDPELAAIVVTFDRPMQDRSWSVVGGGPEFPTITGEP
ncbi:MAG: DUF4932 domain-containing protein [Phycisphaerales bacterium]|nr:DUF4932 domain-containing protein [Phycisphaerales bacterium]